MIIPSIVTRLPLGPNGPNGPSCVPLIVHRVATRSSTVNWSSTVRCRSGKAVSMPASMSLNSGSVRSRFGPPFTWIEQSGLECVVDGCDIPAVQSVGNYLLGLCHGQRHWLAPFLVVDLYR